MSDQSIRGRFLWHELVTADLKAAGRFFTKIADWKTEGWDQNPDYQMFVAKTGPMAGLAVLDAQSRAAGARPHWLTYIGSPDAAETGRQAVALGGRILKPLTEMPPVGKWVVLQDPQGAVFAAFTPSQAPTAPEHPVAARRLLVARAGDERREGGVRVLQEAVRLAGDERHGHGARSRRVSDVRARWRAAWRHLQQAEKRAGPLGVAAIHPGDRRTHDAGRDEERRRSGDQRAAGSARWRLDHDGAGSAGRRVRDALGEAGGAGQGGQAGPRRPSGPSRARRAKKGKQGKKAKAGKKARAVKKAGTAARSEESQQRSRGRRRARRRRRDARPGGAASRRRA